MGKDSIITLSLQPQLEETEELQKRYNGAITKFGEEGQSTLTKFFREKSINDSSEIDYWNRVTGDAYDAEEAIKMYNEAKKKEIPSTFTGLWDSIGTGDDDTSKAQAQEKERLLELAEAGKLTEEELKYSSIADVFTEAGYSISEATKEVKTN